MSENYIQWARAAVIRAVKTGAEVLASLIGTGTVGILDLDWPQMLSVTATAMVLSLLASVAGIPEVADGASVAKMRGGAE